MHRGARAPLRARAPEPVVDALPRARTQDIDDRDIFPPEEVEQQVPRAPDEAMRSEDDAAAPSPPRDEWMRLNCAERLVDGLRRALFVHGSFVPNAYSDEALAPMREHIRQLVRSLEGGIIGQDGDLYVLKRVERYELERDTCPVDTEGGMVIDVVMRAWCLSLSAGTRADVAYGSQDAASLLDSLPAHVGAELEDAKRPARTVVATGALKGAEDVKVLVLADCGGDTTTLETEQTVTILKTIAYRLRDCPAKNGVVCVAIR